MSKKILTMILTMENICFYLIEKGFLNTRQIVDGEYRVDFIGSRNNNFVVNRGLERSYFIKQSNPSIRDELESLKTEATCYWLASNDENYTFLKGHLPGYFNYDSTNQVLVLGYEEGFHSLGNSNGSDGQCLQQIGPELGKVLASYHMHKHIEVSFFKKQKPWIFSVANITQTNHNPEDKKAESQVIELIRSTPRFAEMISSAAQQYEFTSLIHNDVKFTNFIIKDAVTHHEIPEIKLIDWELADIGDPSWDTGSVFASYLQSWIYSEPHNTTGSGLTLEKIQPVLLDFWKAYVKVMGLNMIDAKDKLYKTVCFCALRLIHFCFESTPFTQSLSPQCARSLQLSYKILEDPEQALTSLLKFNLARYE
jgi:thiamine kinase-like enzyme